MAACPCHLPHRTSASHGGDLGAADCPRHPPSRVSPCQGPQCGHLWLLPTSVSVSGLVATEETSLWPPVAVTHFHVCHRGSGHGSDLSVAACPCRTSCRMSPSWWPHRGRQRGSLSPVSVRVSGLVASEGTSVWLPVPVSRLCVCHSPGGCGGDFSVGACPCYLSCCMSQPWWPQRGP